MSFNIFNSTDFKSTNSELQSDLLKQNENESVKKLRNQFVEKTKSQLELNEKEVAKHSILDREISKNSPLYKMMQDFDSFDPGNGLDPIKMLVNTNLSFSAKRTGYEGVDNTARVYSYAFEMINEKQGIFSQKVPDEVIHNFQTLQKLKIKTYQESHAKEFMNAVLKLKISESYSAMSGWAGFPGHTMICRFERTGSEKFNIYIYNAQNGSEQINGGMVQNGKTKVTPYLVLKNVTFQELFFCEPNETQHANDSIFANLLKLQDEKHVPPRCSFQNVLNCFAHVSDKLETSDRLPALFISTQKSGNCDVKSSNCLLLDLLGSTDKYKPISFDIRLIILIACFHHFKKQKEQNPLHLFQLREAATHFLCKLDSNFKRPQTPITEECYLQGFATVSHLLNELKKIEAENRKQIKTISPLKEIYHAESSQTIIKNRQKNAIDLSKKLLSIEKSPIQKELVSLQQNLGLKANWEDLSSVIETLGSMVDKLTKCNRHQDIILQVERTLLNLTHLKRCKVTLERTDILKVSHSLLSLQKKYSNSVFEMNEVASPASQNTMMEFLAIGYTLTLAADAEFGVLKNYSLGTSYFKTFPQEDRLYTIQDPFLIQQRNDLLNFFNHHNQSYSIFDFENFRFNDSEFIKGESTPGRFYKDYIEKSDTIKKELSDLIKDSDTSVTTHKAMCAARDICFFSFSPSKFPKSLEHLALLKSIALFACESSNIGIRTKITSPDMGHKTAQDLKVTTGNSTWCTDSKWVYTNTGKRYGLNDQRYTIGKNEFSYDEELNKYCKDSQSSFKSHELIPENALLVSSTCWESQGDPLHPLKLCLAEPPVQTTLLLNALEEHLDLLKTPSFRMQIEHMFIKIVNLNYNDGTCFSPFFDSLKNPTYLQRFEKLLTIGKKKFVEMMPIQKPCLDEILFLIRLYARALQITYALNPQMTHSKETFEIIRQHLDLLDKFKGFPDLSDTMKGELSLAKVGLMLGISPTTLSPKQLADFFICITTVRHMPPHSICADRPFLKECKRKFFALHQQWQDSLTDSSALNEFANTVLSTILEKKDLQLNWELKEGVISAKDKENEIWKIDLHEISLANSNGPCIEVGTTLSSDSFSRLFNNKRYQCKIFGPETRFHDPIWGSVRILTHGKEEMIQRQINDSWFTYVPATDPHQTQLKLNDALFFDHALWINNDHPEEIRAYDLTTGIERYRINQGICTDSKTKWQFYPLEDFKNYPLLDRFDTINRVNSWFEISQGEVTDAVVEFSRFLTHEGQLLSFSWDPIKKAWIYSGDSNFEIDTGPDLDIKFNVNRFISLVDPVSNKRKYLIPIGTIMSQGYQQNARIFIYNMSGSNQIGEFRFFEYDLTNDGRLHPLSLESKVYLINLYLAQKRYQQAMELLESISISEEATEATLGYVKELVTSAYDLHDLSPNSCAVHLQTYLLFKKIAPFHKTLDIQKLPEIIFSYHTYLKGLKHIEQPLHIHLEDELRLIEILDGYRNDNDDKEKSNKITSILDYVSERGKVLKGSRWKTMQMVTTQDSHFSLNRPYFVSCEFEISEEEEKQKKSNAANELFKDGGDSSLFLNSFQDFERCYQVLTTTCDNTKPQAQGIWYELSSATKLHDFGNRRRDLLMFVACFPKISPKLPNKDASDEEKLVWFKGLKWKYEQLSRSHNKQSKHSEWTFNEPRINNRLLVDSVDTSLPFNTHHPIKIAPSQIEFSRTGQDGIFYQWQERYLEVPKIEEKSSIQDLPKIDIQDLQLDESEKIHAKAIEKHLNYYEIDRQHALRNAKARRKFKPDADISKLIEELKEEQRFSEANEEELLKVIQLAKRSPFDLSLFVKEKVKILGEVRRELTLPQILRAAVSTEGLSELLKLNPNLTSEEAKEICSASIEYMVESTHRSHIDRILSHLQKWIDSGKKDPVSLKAAEEAINESRTYDPTINTSALLFEYLSDSMRIRGKQSSILKLVLDTLIAKTDSKFAKKVFSLIMNGGKTSVIISMLVELLAESGYLTYVLCHHSQLASVKGNIAELQEKRFAKKTYYIDYSIQDLNNPEILDLILKKTSEAHRKRCPIVTRSTFPGLVVNKFILECLRHKSIRRSKIKKEHLENLKKLQKIAFPGIRAGIWDESDLNLSIMLSVIIPLGEPKNVSPVRAQLVMTIVKTMLDPKIKDLIGLENNEQAELSLKDLQGKVLPFIAEKIFEVESLKLKDKPKEFKQPFIRFVTGRIPATDQKIADEKQYDLTLLSGDQKENVLFLRRLASFRYSDDRYQVEAAHLISLSRGVLYKMLEIVLGNSFNQGFGWDFDHDDGRVCPYNGAGDKSHTKFGNIYIELLYQSLSSLNHHLSKGAISFLAKKMTEAANAYSSTDNVPFEDTLEAIQFLELTSVPLGTIFEPGELEKAFQYINDPYHLKRRLAVDAELSPFHVRYSPKTISNNAINRDSQFSKTVACSGTIWNHPTYHRKYGTPAFETGTEGAILNRMEELAKDNPNWIHEIKKFDLETVFDLIRKLPKEKKTKFRGLIDPAGLMKNCSTVQAMLAFQSFFQEEEKNGGPIIDGIVYLHKFSLEEVKQGMPKESYVLLKRNETKPHLLKTTNTEEIEQFGVKKENLFSFFHELGSSGTNILLDDSGFFFQTASHKMPIRQALQGYYRPRGIFQDQRIEFLITTKSREQMIGGGKTFDQFSKTLKKNESILLEKQINIALYAQIDDIFHLACSEEMAAEKDPSKLGDIAEKYESVFVTHHEDDPYAQWGRIAGRAPAIEVLRSHAERRLKKFQETGSPSYPTVEKEVQKLLAEFEEELPKDKELDLSPVEDLNTMVEIEYDKVLDVETQGQVTITQDIELELFKYSFETKNTPRKEQPWSFNLKDPIWSQLQKNVKSVPQILQTRFKNDVSTGAYAPCFPKNLWMSDNFCYTTEELLPIFHPYHKTPGFMLVVESKGQEPQFVLVSESDATYFKNWISKNLLKDVSLVDLQGVAEVTTQSMENRPEEFKKALLQGLWYANLFKGNVDFLEKHLTLTVDLSSKHIELMTRFLLLRAGKDQRKLSQLRANPLLGSQLQVLNQNRHEGVIFSSRRKAIERNYVKIRQYGAEEIAELPPESVPDIAPHQVRWLKKKEQLEVLPDKLIEFMIEEQVPLFPVGKIHLFKKRELIQSLEENCKYLEPNQLIHVSPKQLKWLADDKIDFIPDLVLQQVEDANQIHRFRKKRLAALSGKQVDLIDAEDVVNLSPVQIADLRKPILIEKVDATKAQYIDKDCIQHMTSVDAMVALLSRGFFTDDQKEKIKQYFANAKFDESKLVPWHVAYLPLEQIPMLTLEPLVCAIPVKAAFKITKEQVQHLKDPEYELIEMLEYPVFLHLPCTSRYLLTPQQLQLLKPIDKDFIADLLPNNVHSLTDESLQFINTSIVNNLASTVIKRLTNPLLLVALNKDNINCLKESQKDILRKAFEGVVTTDQIQNIADRHLQFIPYTSASEMDVGSTSLADRIRLLTSSHWLYLTADQVRTLHQFSLQTLLTDITPHLNIDALEGLDKNYAKFLKSYQIQNLGQTHLQLIQALRKPEDLTFLSNQSLNLIRPEQVVHLNSEDLKRLTNPNLLLAVPKTHLLDLNPDQHELLKKTVQTLDADRVPPHLLYLMTDDQVRGLTKPENMIELPPDKIALLTEKQIRSIHWNVLRQEWLHPYRTSFTDIGKDGLRAFNDPFYTQIYPYLSEKQIKQLDGSHIGIIRGLDPKVLGLLSDEALQLITLTQFLQIESETFKRITNPDLLLKTPRFSKALQPHQSLILQKEISNRNPNTVPTDFLDYLTDQQVRDLTDPTKILALPTEKWSLLSKEQVASIPPLHLRMKWQLNQKNVVEKLGMQALAALNHQGYAFAVPLLTPGQIRHLDDTHELIIQNLASEHLSLLSDDAIQHIRPEQMDDMQMGDFQRLTNPALLYAVPENRVGHLQDNQKQILQNVVQAQDPNTVPMHTLDYLSEDQVPRLIDLHKILELSEAKRPFLTSEQVERVPSDALTQNFVAHLGPQGLRGIANPRGQFTYPHLRPEQISQLDQSHAYIIQHLAPAMLSYLSDEALQETSPLQLVSMPVDALNRLRKKELILAIPGYRIAELDPHSMVFYIEAINTLQDVSKLQPHHLPYIKPEAPILGMIEDPQLLQLLQPALFAHLTQKQLMALEHETLTQEQIRSLTVEKLIWIKNPKHIAHISTSQIELMTHDHQQQIDHLTATQIESCSLFPKALINMLKHDKLQCLHNELVNLRQVPEQLQKHLSDNQLRTLCAPQYGSRLQQVVKGIGLSLLFLPRLLTQFVFNVGMLLGMSLISIFSATMRAKLEKQMLETFENAPARAFAGFYLLFDYVPYHRIHLEYS